jgi:hypothetical protein
VDREQDVQRPEPDRLDGEEVKRKDARRLRPQELAPGQAVSQWRRADAVRTQQRADLSRRDSDAELCQLAPDSDAALSGVLPPIRRMRSRTSSLIGGLPAVDLRWKVHFRLAAPGAP